MKYFLILFLTIPFYFTSSFAQNLDGGYWAVNKKSIVHNGSNHVSFLKNGQSNRIDLSKIKIQFNSNGTYNGFNIDGHTMDGFWNIQGDSLIRQNDQFLINSERKLLLTFINNDKLELTGTDQFIDFNTGTGLIDVESKTEYVRMNDCLDTIVIGGNDIPSGEYYADVIITHGRIKGGSIVKYNVSDSVQITKDLIIENNATFEVVIQSCPF